MSELRPRLAVMTPAADLYGSDRSLLNALPVLAERYDVVLFSAVEGPLLDRARAMGIDVRVTADWALRRRMLQPAALPATVRSIRATLADIRAAHAERPFAAIYANTTANAALPLLRRVADVPVIVHIRELPRDSPRQLRLLLRLVHRSAAAVITNSVFTAEAAIAIEPRLADRTRVVLNSVPAPRRPPVPPPSDGRFHIACVGRIHPKKGQDVLIDAAGLAAARGADWHLHFHGDALPEHRHLEWRLKDAVTRLGLEDRVTWHGYDSDTDVLYDRAHVAVVPSVTPEEFSLVTGEAQIRGLPVVATGPGGPSEIVDDGGTGTIVPAGDPVALAEALGELDQHPSRRERWGAAAAERAEALLGIDRYRAEIVRNIADVVERRPSVIVLSPSSDLYGSDRALLYALASVVEVAPVLVMCAAPGPFVGRARAQGAAVAVTEDFAVRRRFLTLRQLPATAWRSLTMARRIRAATRRFDARLIYVNTVAVPIIPFLRLITGRRVLVHVHERALGGRGEAALLRWAINHGADDLVTNSQWTAATLAERAQARVTVVYNGVEPVPPVREVGRRVDFRLVFVGRLHPKKGHLDLLEAVARLNDAGVVVHVDLVGDALPEHAALESRIRRLVIERGIASQVVFHGYVDDPDPIYRGGDVVVVPSASPEEFSVVAAEGQMRALPAIVTGPGGVAEVVHDGETGLVVPAGDIDAIATAIGRLEADRDLARRLGEQGRVRMLELFTVDRYRQDLAAAVQRALDTRGGGG